MRNPRHCGAASIAVFDAAVPLAERGIRGPQFHAVPARVLDQLRGAVETHRLAVEQRGQELRRVMTF
jgi:hypothetical protein